jgi:hypothetical protein
MNNGAYTVEGSIENSLELATEDQLTTNLEIVAPEPVRVTFMEEQKDEHGEPQLVPRIALIRTYVPIFAFHEMLRDRQKLLKEVRRKKLEILRSPDNDGTEEIKEILMEEAKEVEQSIMMDWLTRQVLNVWKLTEKDMTIERFELGVEFEQVEVLFNRFFGGLMRSKRYKDKLRQQG